LARANLAGSPTGSRFPAVRIERVGALRQERDKNMDSSDLEQRIGLLESELTPAFVERVVHELLQQRKDGGSGVGAIRVVMHLVRDLAVRDADLMPIYYRLKPALRAAVEQSPALWFLEGG
jgi:hypothetical protein